jgi:hypothetical protein
MDTVYILAILRNHGCYTISKPRGVWYDVASKLRATHTALRRQSPARGGCSMRRGLPMSARIVGLADGMPHGPPACKIGDPRGLLESLAEKHLTQNQMFGGG